MNIVQEEIAAMRRMDAQDARHAMQEERDRGAGRGSAPLGWRARRTSGDGGGGASSRCGIGSARSLS